MLIALFVCSSVCLTVSFLFINRFIHLSLYPAVCLVSVVVNFSILTAVRYLLHQMASKSSFVQSHAFGFVGQDAAGYLWNSSVRRSTLNCFYALRVSLSFCKLACMSICPLFYSDKFAIVFVYNLCILCN